MQASIKNTVLINHSLLKTVKAGKFYPTLKKNNKSYIFDRVEKKTLLNTKKLKWQEVDNVVMIVKINWLPT